MQKAFQKIPTNKQLQTRMFNPIWNKRIEESDRKFTSKLVRANSIIEHIIVLGCLTSQMHQITPYKYSSVKGVFKSEMKTVILNHLVLATQETLIKCSQK